MTWLVGRTRMRMAAGIEVIAGTRRIGGAAITLLVDVGAFWPGGAQSFLDRAVIIHGKRDDGGQPTGNAGPRIGCGVIKRD